MAGLYQARREPGLLAYAGLALLRVLRVPLCPNFQLLPALSHIEIDFRKTWANGKTPEDKSAALVLTGERDKGKFFSNGLQLELVKPGDGFFKEVYYKSVSPRALIRPCATVAQSISLELIHSLAGCSPGC